MIVDRLDIFIPGRHHVSTVGNKACRLVRESDIRRSQLRAKQTL